MEQQALASVEKTKPDEIVVDESQQQAELRYPQS